MSPPSKKRNSDSIQISGKVLGELARPDFCERCFWIKFKMRSRIPYSYFPGIFSSIDSFTKKAIHRFMDVHGTAPEYLNAIGKVKRYIEPPHHSSFYYHDMQTNIILTGSADGIFELFDGSLTIVDYKTAKFTNTQDILLPTYAAQLNSYAVIAEILGMGHVSKLALVYMEPLTESHDETQLFCSHERLEMYLDPKILDVTRDYNLIPKLLSRASVILTSQTPPAGAKECKDCKNVDLFVNLMQ